MVVAACALLVVVGPRPAREADRLVGEFVKGLLHEFGTGQAVMHPDGLPTRSVTGAIPEWAWSSAAQCQRARSVPAAARRGATTAPAPGKLVKRS